MIEQLLDFVKLVQKYLMKKQREYGELKYLMHRTTAETSYKIDDLISGIIGITKSCDITWTGRDVVHDPLLTQWYKFMLFNTNFNVQPYFTDDVTYGHMADICPPISPYVFMQLLFKLKCQDILIESIRYIPITLCIELIEITISCIMEFSFPIALPIVSTLLYNIYQRCLTLTTKGSESHDIKEETRHFVASFEKSLDILSNDKVTMLSKMSRIDKCQQQGVLLKEIMRIIMKCMKCKVAGVSFEPCVDKLYKISFGREEVTYLDNGLLKKTIDSLDNELESLLLKKIKEIDCDTYLGWAELDDTENTMITMQRSICIQGHYFMEFLVTDDHLSKNNDLTECLGLLLSSKNSENPILSLQELCHMVVSNKGIGIKELMKRYKEWDKPSLEFIKHNANLLTKEDCRYLLKYMGFAFSQLSYNKVRKDEIYDVVIKIILRQPISDIYDIVLTYVTKHFEENYFEKLFNPVLFDNFIRCNEGTQDGLNLRVLLIFLLLSPREVLTTIIKIIIGCPEYSDVIFFPNEIKLLRPLLATHLRYGYTCLTLILQDISILRAEWDIKKYTDFVTFVLENDITIADDLMNNVFIPFLINGSTIPENTICILSNIRYHMAKYKDFDKVTLFVSLGRRMRDLRQHPYMQKYQSDEMILHATRLIEKSLQYSQSKLCINEARYVIDAIANYIEPVDKALFAPFWHLLKGDILNIIYDYERRCGAVVKRLKLNPGTPKKLRSLATTVKLNRQVFLRHLFVRTTSIEYQKYTFQLVSLFWFFFGWSSEVDAFDNVLRITIESIRLQMEYLHIAPNNSFTVILTNAIRMCRLFINRINQDEKIYHSLARNILHLNKTLENTTVAEAFSELLARMDKIQSSDFRANYYNLLDMLERFVTNHLETISPFENEEAFVLQNSDDVARMYCGHQFICACLMQPSTGSHLLVHMMEEMFSSINVW